MFSSAVREEINFGLKELAGRFETALMVAEVNQSALFLGLSLT